MRTLARVALAVVCAACDARAVELFTDGPVSAADAAAADTLAADAEAAPDAPTPDAAAADAEAAPDAPAPDAAPSSCVCRFPFCRTDPDCEARIGAGSRCAASYCTGSVSSCRVDTECPTNFVCVTGPSSTTPCP